MAVIKCKMCGGDLILMEGHSVAQCEYCGSRQTVPSGDNEKKLLQFERAERLRRNCEFDKASGLYEAIVSDFRQESEAYWGLVLCKYGIEYVDDPATGKKIPTCHRSSFESILDDSDFEQALENADSVARRVYREEAKQIEQIRRGIIAVSANEQPYDIFICYKETDENGDRTLDSVLAQDIYDALTEKGYRTFFSRISLEDKLGQEYEPYIFAALNSAKIMLAVGTDYEFYNAVWVKNEWSRFLKLMEKDKSKYLIPCYKGIDAYDMPREFAKLQAQDLGKVGAMQDLLRGIDKILPKQKNTTVIQEKVVVGSTGGSNKVTALLERGNMALEDGDWAKADSFFEDVLNNDARNAQAYIGKTLAQERCRTMDALVRKRKELCANVPAEILHLPENQLHISQIVEKYVIPGYIEENVIRNRYKTDLSYRSFVSGLKKQYADELHWWTNHRLLSRAEQFATGTVASTLQQEKQNLVAQFSEQIKQAERADAETVAQMTQSYDAFLAETDAILERLHQENWVLREKQYDAWFAQSKTATAPDLLLSLADSFDNLEDYRDSKNLAEHCRRRAEEEQDKLDEAEARRRIKEEQTAKALKEKKKKQMQRRAVSAAGLLIVLVLLIEVIIPGFVYASAKRKLAEGQYRAAAKAFGILGTYKDSASKKSEAEKAKQYHDGILLLEVGKSQDIDNKEAMQILEEIEKRIEEEEKLYQAHAATAAAAAMPFDPETEEDIAEYTQGELFAIECFEGAEYLFTKLQGYSDSNKMLLSVAEALQDIENSENMRQYASEYDQAYALLEGGDTANAAIAFGKLSKHLDVRDQSLALWAQLTERKAIATGYKHTIGIKKDGTLMATGVQDDGQCNVSNWTHIVAVDAENGHTVGLKDDGTVVAIGYNDDGQCNVSDWTNIVSIAAGSFQTIGLKDDGTVVAVGWNDHGQCNVSGWTDMVAISAGGYHTVGVKSDGTVKAIGNNEKGQCDVSDWTDIVAVAAGRGHTVGLKADGTVVAVGLNSYGQCDVSDWTDIAAISADNGQTVGLKADGTVVAVGYNEYEQCNVSDWTDIVAVSAGSFHTIGLKTDGTVVAAGWNKDAQCNVSDWKNIQLPH